MTTTGQVDVVNSTVGHLESDRQLPAAVTEELLRVKCAGKAIAEELPHLSQECCTN